MCLDLTLPRDSTAPRLARSSLTALLDSAGASELIGDAQLVVTELVTNALRHARGLVQLHADVDDEAVRIEVADESAEQLPVRQAASPGPSVGGHGMALIDTIATRWGVIRLSRGKVVWVELTR